MPDSPFSPYESTANHEASHAVAAVRLGIQFESVRVDLYDMIAQPEDDIGGLHLPNKPGAMGREDIERLVVVALAGEARRGKGVGNRFRSKVPDRFSGHPRRLSVNPSPSMIRRRWAKDIAGQDIAR